MAQNTPKDDVIHNVFSGETNQSLFACSDCRRQKVKCDRTLPTCANCTKANRPCTYPLTVQKPGPKAGTHRRPRASVAASDAPSILVNEPGTKRPKLDGGLSRLPAPPTTQVTRRQSNGAVETSFRIHRDSTSTSTTSRSPRATTRSDDLLLRLVHPTHDPADNYPSHDDAHNKSQAASQTRFRKACVRLSCSENQGRELIRAYFDHMAAFSLFHRPSFEQKLRGIVNQRQLEAFLSALFSYALRFKDEVPLVKDSGLSATSMLDLSCQLQQDCIEDCLDEDPPLHLLQSLYIVTWQKLIQGVRGKTWRMLGDCIRIGYELQLNMIDADHGRNKFNEDAPTTEESSIAREERRRMWWSLWEADIFTSTIRRLPNAIDERLIFTLLPVTDEEWFGGFESASCFLAADATQRWGHVVDSGNNSPQTWFILLNSYMFDAHKMAIFPEVWAKRIGFEESTRVSGDDPESFIPKMRDFIDNCLHCAYMSLPVDLRWEDKFLAFGCSVPGNKSFLRSQDNARYCIHVMCQLSRLMLCVWEVQRASIPLVNGNTQLPKKAEAGIPGVPRSFKVGSDNDARIWDRCLDASNLVAEVIRNSSPQHYQYVNPLIANSIWYAAASLVVAKLFGPPDFNSRLAQSNFDLFVATLKKFELFWGIPKILEVKLKSLETALQALGQKPSTGSLSGATTPTKVQSATRNDVNLSAPQDMQQQYGQQFTYGAVVGPSSRHTMFDAHEQDWLSQSFFDFDTIPTFGLGQTDALQQLPFDGIFESNPFVTGDGLDFSDLFNYPYQ